MHLKFSEIHNIPIADKNVHNLLNFLVLKLYDDKTGNIYFRHMWLS